MAENNKKPAYDLEERTFQFAKRVRLYTKKLPRNISNIEDSKQLVKASGSVGANYFEANESLSRKDFLYRTKVCRKESKEGAFFLRLIYETNPKEFEAEGVDLRNEAIELKKIFSSMIRNSERSHSQ